MVDGVGCVVDVLWLCDCLCVDDVGLGCDFDGVFDFVGVLLFLFWFVGCDWGLYVWWKLCCDDDFVEFVCFYVGWCCFVCDFEGCIFWSCCLMFVVYKIIDYIYDVVVVGVGGFGLCVMMGIVESGLKIVCIIKVFLMCSYMVVV